MTVVQSSFLWRNRLCSLLPDVDDLCHISVAHSLVARNRQCNKCVKSPTHGFHSDFIGTALNRGWSLISVTETQQYSLKSTVYMLITVGKFVPKLHFWKTNMFLASGGFAPIAPDQGLCPGPRWGLRPKTLAIGSRATLVISPPPHFSRLICAASRLRILYVLGIKTIFIPVTAFDVPMRTKKKYTMYNIVCW